MAKRGTGAEWAWTGAAHEFRRQQAIEAGVTSWEQLNHAVLLPWRQLPKDMRHKLVLRNRRITKQYHDRLVSAGLITRRGRKWYIKGE